MLVSSWWISWVKWSSLADTGMSSQCTRRGERGFLLVLLMDPLKIEYSNGVNTFYAYAVGDDLATSYTLNALQVALALLKSNSVKLSNASSVNPRIPPSSLMMFLKKNSRASGIVLENFDTSFSNEFNYSHLEDIANVNSMPIVAAASLIARSLYILAKDAENMTTLDLSVININTSLVEELLQGSW